MPRTDSLLQSRWPRRIKILFAVAVMPAVIVPTTPAIASADTVVEYIGNSWSQEVAVSPDGSRAYVTTGNTVSVIDTDSRTLTQTIRTGRGSQGVVVTPDGAHVYVTNKSDDTVSVIDTSSNSVVSTIPVGLEPVDVALTPDGSLAYVTNYYGNSVSVIDTATNSVADTILVGERPTGVAITPDGTRAYVTSSGEHAVSVIDIATATEYAIIPVGGYPQGIAITPDGQKAYVVLFGSAGVVVIGIDTYTVTTTISVGKFRSLQSVAITPDGSRAYVPSYEDQTVYIVDTSTEKVTDEISLKPDAPYGFPSSSPNGSPQDIAISPNGAYAYAAGTYLNEDRTKSLGLAVIEIRQPALLRGTPPFGVIRQPYDFSFEVFGQPSPDVSLAAGSLPEGLTLTPGGRLFGVPTETGVFAFEVAAENGIGEVARTSVLLEVYGSSTGSSLASSGSAGSGSGSTGGSGGSLESSDSPGSGTLANGVIPFS